ncbi:MAG: hypothetical protein RL215_545, partial [Planctomycetota bacterium]
LLGAEVGCEQVEQYGDAAEGDAGSLFESEEFLDTDSEDGWASWGVFEADA